MMKMAYYASGGNDFSGEGAEKEEAVYNAYWEKMHEIYVIADRRFPRSPEVQTVEEMFAVEDINETARRKHRDDLTAKAEAEGFWRVNQSKAGEHAQEEIHTPNGSIRLTPESLGSHIYVIEFIEA